MLSVQKTLQSNIHNTLWRDISIVFALQMDNKILNELPKIIVNW